MSTLSLQMRSKRAGRHDRMALQGDTLITSFQFNLLRVIIEQTANKSIVCALDMTRKTPLLKVLSPHNCSIETMPASEMNGLVARDMIAVTHESSDALRFCVTEWGAEVLLNNIANGIINSINKTEFNILLYMVRFMNSEAKIGRKGSRPRYWALVNKMAQYAKRAEVTMAIERLLKYRILRSAHKGDDDHFNVDNLESRKFDLNRSGVGKFIYRDLANCQLSYEMPEEGETDEVSLSGDLLAANLYMFNKDANRYTCS